jgi:transcriptional regulator with GAF, ATPase, and Fis domain
LLEVDSALELKLEDASLVKAESGPLVSGTLEAMERTHILKVLEEQGWIIEGSRGAAAVLGMKPSTLRSRMQKLNIRKSK